MNRTLKQKSNINKIEKISTNMTTSGSLLLLSFLLIIYNGGIKTKPNTMATKLNNNRSASKMYQMASNTFETITIMIATISLAIIATAISSGSLNGMNVAAAAAAAVTTISLTDQQPKVAALIPTLHVSSASALASATMPDYGITNVTAQVGTNAYLPCKVKIVFNKSVSWVRVRDDHILTVDQITFIADERFHAYHATESTGQSSVSSPSSNQRRQHLAGITTQTTSSAQKQATNNDSTNAPWTLQIKYVQARDAGLYECQISAEPKISARVYLHVVVPKTEPIGDTVRYVKEGSRVALHCVISGAIDPPLYVIWYHGQQQIFPENARQWKTEISHQDIQNKLPKTDDTEPLPSVQQSMFESRKTVGSLIIPAIKKKDSGNYTCDPSNSPTVTIVLHVINGEYSASAITSSSSGCDHQRKTFNRILNILCVGVTLIISLITT